ncbi:hypothetical protein U1Q18_048437 [Sarracenia purpurea var. burkii]
MEISKNIPRSDDILTNVSQAIDPIVNTNVVNNSSVANSIGKEISMLHTNTNKVSQRKIGSESDSASSSQITTTNQRPICSSKLFKELKMPIFKRIGTSENSEETSEESFDTNDLIPYAPGKLDESDSEEPTRVPPELKEVHDRVQRSLETRDALSSDMFEAIQTLGMVTVGQRHAIQQLHAETSASNSKVDDRLNELKKVNEMFTEELKNQELITKGFYEHLIETRNTGDKYFRENEAKFETLSQAIVSNDQALVGNANLIQVLQKTTDSCVTRIAKLEKSGGGPGTQSKSLPFSVDTFRNVGIEFTESERCHPHYFLENFENYLKDQQVDEASMCSLFRGLIRTTDSKNWKEYTRSVTNFRALAKDFLQEFWSTQKQRKALLVFQEDTPRVNNLREMARCLLKWTTTLSNIKSLETSEMIASIIGKVPNEHISRFTDEEREDLPSLVERLESLQQSHEDEIPIAKFIIGNTHVSEYKRPSREQEAKRRIPPKYEDHRYKSGDRRYKPDENKYRSYNRDRRFDDREPRSDKRDRRDDRDRRSDDRDKRSDNRERRYDDRDRRSDDRRYKPSSNAKQDDHRRQPDGQRPQSDKRKDTSQRQGSSWRKDDKPEFREKKDLPPKQKDVEVRVVKPTHDGKSEPEEFDVEYTPEHSDALETEYETLSSENEDGED